MAEPRDVLILDDEESVCRYLCRMLKGHHTARSATTTEAALALIEARVPDVLVCDYQLVGCTAEAFLVMVRARWPSIYRVLHSGAGSHLWTELVDDGVVDAVLLKPAKAAAVLAAVEAA